MCDSARTEAAALRETVAEAHDDAGVAERARESLSSWEQVEREATESLEMCLAGQRRIDASIASLERLIGRSM